MKTPMVEIPPSFRSLSMASGVRSAMYREPKKTAIIHGERKLTYCDLVRRIDQVTDSTIGDLGLQPGQNVAIIARNCTEYFEIVCGVPDAGVAVATINPRYTAREIEAVCDDAEIQVIFTDTATAPVVRSAQFRTVTRIIEFGPEYEKWLNQGESTSTRRPIVSEWDVWTIPYTSGTTGRPKGVMLSHRSRSLVAFASAAEFGCFSPDDRFLAMTPLNHGGGLAFPMASLLHGGTVEIMDGFDPVRVLEKLKFAGITGVFMVPTHFQQIFALDDRVRAECQHPPIKAIICNAAPLPQALKKKIVPFFGKSVLFEVYSSTEMGLVSSLRPADQLRKQGCVGLPQAHTQVRILDENYAECPAEKVGELFSRSPYLFNGYWNRPEETAAVFRDGWVSVGDMAKRDSEGYIYIVDRKKDMVISGGVNIYPREIEETLLHHPAVADAAVIGIPDEKWGERLRAFVVLRDGAHFDTQDLIEICTSQLAGYKIPRELRIIDALPRNSNGKVLKTELRTFP